MNVTNFYINRLKVDNFKNFQNLKVELDRFNMIIGPNASGKSNFKNIFSFLKDIVDKGLQDALSIHGGRGYVLNFNAKEPLLSIEIHFLSDTPEILLPNNDYLPKLEARRLVSVLPTVCLLTSCSGNLWWRPFFSIEFNVI